MSVGGRGGLHRVFLTRRVLTVEESSLSPAKNVLMPMSRSNFEVVCSIAAVVEVKVGFGMNFKPRPSRW